MNQTILDLYQEHFGAAAQDIKALPLSGSDRLYYRLSSPLGQALGVENPAQEENLAFVSFTQSFLKLGLPVPKLLAQSLDQNCYLIEDLGPNTLLQSLEEARQNGEGHFPDRFYQYYKKALIALLDLQIEGHQEVDYSLAYPKADFDKQSMQWDCQSFKYWYLLPAKLPFDAEALEQDFDRLVDFLAQAPAHYFMFRDFQARNIIIKDEQPYFIDYQGGRRGPLQYDLVSLLFQAKAQLSNTDRERLLEEYWQALKKREPEWDRQEFERYYLGFVLLRSLQVLGAYGFKGHYQKKGHFLASIPFALANIRWLLMQDLLPLPELNRLLKGLIRQPQEQLPQPQEQALRLHISSFSYKRGLPEDPTGGHGAGFIFDCRFIHNPGRYTPYKKKTGLDEEVKLFLVEDGEIEQFLAQIFPVIEGAIQKYLDRGHSDLGVHFGCTGGQHRSVYSAERLQQFLQSRFGPKLDIRLNHRERPHWPK